MHNRPIELPFNGKTRYIIRRGVHGTGHWRVVMEHPTPNDDRGNVFTNLRAAEAEAEYRNGKYRERRTDNLRTQIGQGARWCDLTPGDQHLLCEFLNDEMDTRAHQGRTVRLWPKLPQEGYGNVADDLLDDPQFFVIELPTGQKRLAAFMTLPALKNDPPVVVLDYQQTFYNPRDTERRNGR